MYTFPLTLVDDIIFGHVLGDPRQLKQGPGMGEMDQSVKNPTDAGKKQDEATHTQKSQSKGGDLFSDSVFF